ncbi:MAG: FAD binding domain-containing protein [Rhizobiaceae bacterium]
MITVETYADINQASAALGADSIYLGGGTLVMRALNYGEQNFSRIVRSTDPSLTQITMQGDRIQIGAAVTMASILAHPDLAFLAPVARQVGGPAVRNMASVGGNLFAEHPYGDLAVALLVLDGRVHLADGQEQDLEVFLAQRKGFNGIVASVSIARPNRPEDFRWLKISRTKPKGVSVMSIAAWLPAMAGRLQNPRIALGAMADTPMRAKAVEQTLEGATMDTAGIQNALTAIASQFNPPDDALASSWYRQQVAPIHLRRLLLNEGAGS